MKHNNLPLVDEEELVSLQTSLQGQQSHSRAFVANFTQMWPQRMERIESSFATRSWENAMDAALSLYSSSTMVGASRLSRQTADVTELLKKNQQLKAAILLAELRRCGDATVLRLTSRYLQRDN